MECLNCGEPLKQVKGKREKKFCDSTCRSNYWQKEKRRSEKLLAPNPILKEAAKAIEFLTPKSEDMEKGLYQRVLESSETIEWPTGKIISALEFPRTFRDYLDIIKAGGFDADRLMEEVMTASGLNSNQREMVLAKIRNS